LVSPIGLGHGCMDRGNDLIPAGLGEDIDLKLAFDAKNRTLEKPDARP